VNLGPEGVARGVAGTHGSRGPPGPRGPRGPHGGGTPPHVCLELAGHPCTLALSMRPILAVVAACALTWMSGCTKIAARDLIREGNTLYHDGKYAEAIAKYDEAAKLEPDGVTLYWNRACAAESIVLKMRDPTLTSDRKLYTDMALSDFKTWLDRLESPTEVDPGRRERLPRSPPRPARRRRALRRPAQLLAGEAQRRAQGGGLVQRHRPPVRQVRAHQGRRPVVRQAHGRLPAVGARLPQPRDPQARAALPRARQRPAVQRQLQRGRAHRHRQRGHRAARQGHGNIDQQLPRGLHLPIDRVHAAPARAPLRRRSAPEHRRRRT
jgi:hypothetical protein